MESTFLKLVDGTRINNWMGLTLDPGMEYVRARDYLHLDVPARKQEDMEVKRNQHIFIEAAGTVDVKGSHLIEVEANPTLSAFGQVQGIHRIHPGTGVRQLGVWFTAHKNCDVSELDYLVRLYMVR